ncbi:MAG: malonate decarboxylase subunit alpha, partial [Caulobacterales bacterium]|nr:malonate decarboxylase subunit alpha [Caulobacterales bacterium]
VQSVLALPEHMDVFENGIARRLDFSFSGPQGARLTRGYVRVGCAVVLGPGFGGRCGADAAFVA